MSETGAIMLAAFCARNVSRTALSASEWADILCVCLCPFPETGIVCGKLHQLTTVLHPPFALNIHNCTFHKAASSEAKSSKMCMRYRNTHCFLFYLIYFFRLAGVCLWTINTGHAISTPCYTRNAQTSKWRVINWRGHNSFVNWQGWKKRNMKKRDVMGGKGIRNERTREQAVFLLVTAMRRHQRSFPPDINNMALSVFFVALGFSLSLSLCFLYVLLHVLAAHRIYGLFQAVSFEPRTRLCGGAEQVIISSFHREINHLITRTSRADPSSLSARPQRRREKLSMS